MAGEARKVMSARLIPWGDDQYGIAVVFERGNYIAYPVGNREEAQRHLRAAVGEQNKQVASKDDVRRVSSLRALGRRRPSR
jgi:hypothetical protein